MKTTSIRGERGGKSYVTVVAKSGQTGEAPLVTNPPPPAVLEPGEDPLCDCCRRRTAQMTLFENDRQDGRMVACDEAWLCVQCARRLAHEILERIGEAYVPPTLARKHGWKLVRR